MSSGFRARLVRAFDSEAHIYALSTPTAPANTLGADGDWAVYYGDASHGLLAWGPKAGGVWPSTPTTQGPTGAAGPSIAIWTPGTAYTAGQVYVRPETGSLWRVVNSHTAVADIRTDIAAGNVAMCNPPAGGRIETTDSKSCNASVALPAVNQIVAYRVNAGGPVGHLRAQVIVSSGNIILAAYKNNGSQGSAAAPGALLGSTGSQPCPAANTFAFLPLGSTIGLADGDWLAIIADNTTATFSTQSTNNSGLAVGAGVCQSQSPGSFAVPNPMVGNPGLIRNIYLSAEA